MLCSWQYSRRCLNMKKEGARMKTEADLREV